VLGDANFPSTSVAKAAGTQVIHADGHDIPKLLKAILQLMPLDKSVESPVSCRFCARVVILSDNYQLPHLVDSHVPLMFNFQKQLNRPIYSNVSQTMIGDLSVFYSIQPKAKLWTGWPGWVDNWRGKRFLSFPKRPDQLWAQLVSHAVGTDESFRAGKAVGL
jgi:hypothetical protein